MIKAKAKASIHRQLFTHTKVQVLRCSLLRRSGALGLWRVEGLPTATALRGGEGSDGSEWVVAGG